VINKHLVVLGEQRIRNETLRPIVDVYEYINNKYEQTLSDCPFVDYLGNNGYKIIEVSEDDQKELGTNFLTIKENHILVASGVSEDYKRKMRNN